jgi:Dockerin type I domain
MCLQFYDLVNRTKRFFSMRITKLAAITALALTATAMVAPSVKAQYDYTHGDFLVGFRQDGNTNSVLADIGALSDPTQSQTFPLGNVGSLLSSTFGANWATDGTVWFSVASTAPVFTDKTNYMTSGGYFGIQPPTVWNRIGSANSTALKNKVIAQGNQYNAFSGSPGVVEPQAQAPDGYREYMPGGTNDAGHATGNIAYGFFNPTTEGNFQFGTAGVFLSLIQLAPTPVGTAGQVLGTFTLSSDGTTLTYTPTAPLQISTVVSRKTHGAAGNFDINLPLSGTPGLESRVGDYTLVATFSNNIVSGNASVTSGVGTVNGSPTFSGNTMTISLTGVTTAQTIIVTLSRVTDQFSHVLPDTPVSMRVLIGDTNANGTVNAGDVALCKSHLGEAANAGNFRTDVNANGTINGADVALVKLHLGDGIP